MVTKCFVSVQQRFLISTLLLLLYSCIGSQTDGHSSMWFMNVQKFINITVVSRALS